jgi:hypothetical protein
MISPPRAVISEPDASAASTTALGKPADMTGCGGKFCAAPGVPGNQTAAGPRARSRGQLRVLAWVDHVTPVPSTDGRTSRRGRHALPHLFSQPETMVKPRPAERLGELLSIAHAPRVALRLPTAGAGRVSQIRPTGGVQQQLADPGFNRSLGTRHPPT